MADKILPNQGRLTERPKTLNSFMNQGEAPHAEKSESLGSHMNQQGAPRSGEKDRKHLCDLMGQ